MENNHWEYQDYRGDEVTVDLKEINGLYRFTIITHRDNEMRYQTYEAFTLNEKTRRTNFLNNGKNPCGKWDDRSGKRICFENGTPLC